VFLRACDVEFNIFEELLKMVPLYETTTGEDVFVSICELLKKYDLPLSKLSSVVIDGAPFMTGKIKVSMRDCKKKRMKLVNINFIGYIALYIKKYYA